MPDQVAGFPMVHRKAGSWFFGGFPRIDQKTYRERLELFSAGPDDESFWEFRRLRFRRLKITALGWGIPVLLIAFTVWAIVADPPPAPPPEPAPEPASWPVVVFGLAFVGLGLGAWVYWAVKVYGLSVKFLKGADKRSHVRFYRGIGNVLTTWDKTGDSIQAVKITGSVARALFLVIQRDQWTWASPPAVSDRAVRLARPLLDIDIPDRPSPRQIDALCSFLVDVAIVVIAGREDLIPQVRRRYQVLPAREADAVDRDVLYLDPMRGRSRWDVVKDYVLPWLSLTIAVVALLISLGG
jgi:hypothetical protein